MHRHIIATSTTRSDASARSMCCGMCMPRSRVELVRTRR